MATIDPLEQFRKGADSNTKTTALELINALSRYYATKGVMPWNISAGDGCTTPPNADPKTLVGSPAFANCLTLLIDQGELKATFPNQKDILNKLRILDAGNGTGGVCFDPESKAESGRAETIYWSFDPNNPNCNPKAQNNCDWCAQW